MSFDWTKHVLCAEKNGIVHMVYTDQDWTTEFYMLCSKAQIPAEAAFQDDDRAINCINCLGWRAP